MEGVFGTLRLFSRKRKAVIEPTVATEERNDERDFHIFLDYLEKEKHNLTIIMAIRDTPGSKMSPDILIRLQNLGFHTLYTELWRMYIGIVDRGNTILDYRAPEKEDTIVHKGNIDGHVLEVCSSSWRRENVASILIDKIEYAINLRGVNLVVYNNKTKSVSASVVYDSHDNLSYYRNIPLLRQKQVYEWLQKERHYDIILLGAYYGSNYGSILNGYAEYRILTGMGKSVLMLSAPGFEIDNPELDENMHNVKFNKSHYDEDTRSPLFKLTELEQLNDYADIFATGSDQLWRWPISFQGIMYQNFVHNDKKKISLATSCGDMNDCVPNSKRDFVKDCLMDFDAISVREESSKILLRKKYGVFSQTILEAVFWLNKEEYGKLVKESDLGIPDKNYILAYILDPDEEKLEFIKQMSRKLKMKVITIPDGLYKTMESGWDKREYIHRYPNCMPHTEVVDFLKLYANCSFSITDSFHGTCFSIIFQRKFVSICNEIRGKDRFYHVLNMFHLEDRLLRSGKLNYHTELIQEIDYEEIEKIIQTEREKTFQWIEEALNRPKKTNHICKVKRDCIGCGACACICPTDALKMVMGQYGYYEPQIDTDKCIDCGKCKSVCPAIEKSDTGNASKPELYECILKDKNELKKCSSGGAFPFLANKILENSGVVYGAAWGDDFRAEYKRINSREQLQELQKSKYIQCYTGTIYRSVKEDLEQGLTVLFSGVPCHVAGLYKFLGKKHENLITVDLLCANGPSVEFFHQYIKEECPEDLISYEFRPKEAGWRCDCVAFTTNDEKKLRQGVKEDLYQRAFHSHIICSKHCEKCNYSKFARVSDFTIGDFWGIEERDITINAKEGVSALLVNNERSARILTDMQDESVFLKKVPLDWLNGNGNTTNDNWAGKGRDAFYDAILEHSFKESLEIAEKV